MTRRREELRTRHPELCDSALWRMPSPNEAEADGQTAEPERHA